MSITSWQELSSCIHIPGSRLSKENENSVGSHIVTKRCAWKLVLSLVHTTYWPKIVMASDNCRGPGYSTGLFPQMQRAGTIWQVALISTTQLILIQGSLCIKSCLKPLHVSSQLILTTKINKPSEADAISIFNTSISYRRELGHRRCS